MRRFVFAILGLCLVASPTFAHAEEDAPATRMKSPGLFAGGITLAVVGSASIPIGALLVLMGSNTRVVCFEGGACPQPNTAPMNIMGGIAIGLGVAAVTASIPMIIVGTHRVPVEVRAGGPASTPGLTLRVTFD